MISDNQMDELFKDRLRDYPSSVPADMWDRILAKKKRDRMIWLFFALFAIGILTLGLTGGYLLLDQKNSGAPVAMGHTKINPKPIATDTLKASLPNLPSTPVHTGPDIMNAVNKKMHQKKNAQLNHSGNFDHAHLNIPEKVSSSHGQNGSEALTVSNDSNELEKNKAAYKKDSMVTKPLVKAAPGDSSKTANVKKPEIKKKLNNGKWFLDVYASPDYPIVPPHEFQQSKLSYSIGIKINRSLGKHFSIKTGIQFSQVNMITGYDSLGLGTTHLMRLDLPVLAGYSVGDEKFKTTFNGGVIFNLYTWLQGDDIPEIFKTNTGLSLYLGVNFERRINDKFSLFGEPYYRYQLTPMTISSFGGLKFIDIAGLSIGARYYFKK
jgi:hypothetical protein